MDRLAFYQAGESMEELLMQAGAVGIYDGDLKHSTFETGTASLTLQKIIWADSSDPDCRLILHHSLVERIERHHKTMFGRGGKIIVHLKPLNSTHVQGQGPVAASGFNSLRFVFRNNGEEEMWKRTSSSSSSGGSSNMHSVGSMGGGSSGSQTATRGGHTMPVGGVGGGGSIGGGSGGGGSGGGGSGGVEAEKRSNDHQSGGKQPEISQALEDLFALMTEATSDIVNLSNSIVERLRQVDEESLSDAEVEKLQTFLFKLGVCYEDERGAEDENLLSNSVCEAAAKHHKQLASEINGLVTTPLQERDDAMMSVVEVFCRINRERVKAGDELVSPEDVVNACRLLHLLDGIEPRLSLDTANDGVLVIKLHSDR